MPNLLQSGSDWLERMRTQHAASMVEYRRASPVQVLSVPATFGRTAYEVVDESGLTIGSHVWDFLVLAEDLGFEPRVGDTIVTAGRRYEVMNLGPDRGWRWSDPYRQTFRIHTREIGPES